MTAEMSESTPLAQDVAGERPGHPPLLVGIALLGCVAVFVWSSRERSRSTDVRSVLPAALEQVAATVTTMQGSRRGHVFAGSGALLDPCRGTTARRGANLVSLRKAVASPPHKLGGTGLGRAVTQASCRPDPRPPVGAAGVTR